MKKLIVISSLILTANFLSGQIINIPADYPTIQQGINVANSGDTVLVASGTYVENINFNGKNITLASNYLLTVDTTYISQTIIDGNNAGSVVIFNNNEDSTTILCGFTLMNGYAYSGGGILCNEASPSLRNLKIINNYANYSMYMGGYGGGVYLLYSNCNIIDVRVINNSAERHGGGIYLRFSNPYFDNVTISSNESEYGGGISCFSSSTVFKATQIKYNYAEKSGGGIYFDVSNPNFDSLNRCDIFLNTAIESNDIYSNSSIEVILDTFTVMYPMEFHAFPISNFSFDIQNCKLTQVDADLFVSPNGSDSNSGLTANDPLKTIHFAFSIIMANSQHHHTVHLLEGTYSPTSNEELFPINIPGFINLEGISETEVFLNAGTTARVMQLNSNTSSTVSNLTITDGHTSDLGGGVYCKLSGHIMGNITIKDNSAGRGGGMYCFNSIPELKKVTIKNNIAYDAGGGLYCDNSNPIFDNIDRCNIYLNTGIYGNDLYSTSYNNIILDTFTVINPTEFLAAPLSNFSFDILNDIFKNINSDVFVSPLGNDTNSGINENDAFKTIHHALTVIRADSLNQNSLNLLAGTYSPSSNGEYFPINIPDFLDIRGVSKEQVFVDAEGSNNVILIDGNAANEISGITITGGDADYMWYTGGGGMEIMFSNPKIKNIRIFNNIGGTHGGGIFCGGSNPILENIVVDSNGSGFWGGGAFFVQSNAVLINALFNNNGHEDQICSHSSSLKIINSTILRYPDKSIHLDDGSECTITNSIIWGEENARIYLGDYGSNSSISISYSDIKSGINGINGSGSIQWLEGNIDEDPLFLENGDHPYSLSDCSPCIDIGTQDTSGLNLPASDLIGNKRIWDGDNNGTSIIDMGAYEYGSIAVNIKQPILMESRCHTELKTFPNPFYQSTTIYLEFKEKRKIALSIYNQLGVEIESIFEGEKEKGIYQLIWDSSDISSGIYFIKLQTDKGITTQKIIKK